MKINSHFGMGEEKDVGYIKSLGDFEVDHIEKENTSYKQLVFFGSLKNAPKSDQGVETDKRAILVIEKNHWRSKNPSLSSKLTFIDQNDKYGTYEAFFPEEGPAHVELIYPCSEKEIKKYSKWEKVLVEESYDQYIEITKKYIDGYPKDHTKWIHNVLDGSAEKEKVIYRDDDCIIAYDWKWDGKNVDCLNLLYICTRRDIQSLRDLNGDHLEFLEHAKVTCEKVVEEKYNLLATKLRIYVHYLPTFYHFHVHILHADLESSSIEVGRAVLLGEVIQNIKLMSDYYQKATLRLCLPSDNPVAVGLSKKNKC